VSLAPNPASASPPILVPPVLAAMGVLLAPAAPAFAYVAGRWAR
jgi:hypothetical protein